MAISNMKATFQCEIQKVWNIVTSLDNYSWRSDLDRIEVIDENRFIEYTKEGYATTFTITNTEPCWRWEFDMDNDNMSGHWIGIFTYANGITTIDFKMCIRDRDRTDYHCLRHSFYARLVFWTEGQQCRGLHEACFEEWRCCSGKQACL